jgi:hypothetical protein
MKKVLFVFTLLLLTGLFSIKPANSESISTKTEMSWSQWIPCANNGKGEFAIGTIIMHNVIHINKDGLVTYTHSQPQSAKLTGEITGMVYKFTGVMLDNGNDYGPIGPGATTWTHIYRFRFVGKGIQFYTKFTWHMIWMPDGEPRIVVSNFSTECE